MKVLIYNWRDIKNPKAGGAEVLTHEMAKGWVQAGHNVTFFAASFKGAKPEEILDGVNIIRAGNAISVYWQAFLHYKRRFKGSFDIIIDEINTMPFFANLYAKEKVICHINQLAKEVWFYESVFPISLLGYLLEPFFLKSYRSNDVITISESTKKDLISLGFKEDKIETIPMGIDFKPLDNLPKKEETPTLIYVGRLKKSKRVHHIIEAYKKAKNKAENLNLWIVGNGDSSYKKYLYSLAEDEEGIKFFHNLSNEDKLKRMARVHLIVVTSVREGWGLIVTEANAMGTPAVVYNVTGLRDSTKDGVTGIIVKKNNPKCLAESILRILNDDELRNKLTGNALMWAREFSWDKSARDALEYIEEVLEKHRNNSVKNT
ncbi:MAG: glycosyltransferase family 4 protein [Candidatus Omnitrophica bacterium]|nr:glycosyltransferase family 4 protein [Candidatus Omnitrophota bacterium]